VPLPKRTWFDATQKPVFCEIADMTFKRQLNVWQRAGLEALKDDPCANWWKDLLSHWVPSGSPSGEHGLRLAIRDGTLNFYRRGQAVALVTFGTRKGGLSLARMKIHARYVNGPVAADEYLEFGAGYCDYPGRDELRRWIANTAYKHGPEKWGVDDIVSNNPEVIDFEVGVPGVAERMDLVALEDDGCGGARLAFWEAKTLDNSELRAAKGEPPVLRQVAGYDNFRRRSEPEILIAYRETCKIICELAKWAGKSDQLSPLFSRAQTHLAPATEVGLVVFRGVFLNAAGNRELKPYPGNWEVHRRKLAARVRLRGADDPADITLNT
jgi:hypothetical protein